MKNTAYQKLGVLSKKNSFFNVFNSAEFSVIKQ